MKDVAFKNDWVDSWLYLPEDSKRPVTIDPPALFVHMGSLPFEAADQRIPGGWSLVDPRRSFIFKVDNPNYGLKGDDKTGRFFWVGQVKTKLYVFAPHEGDYRLCFQAWTTGPGLPETTERHLKMSGPDGVESDLHLHDASSQPSWIDRLRAGINRIETRCVDTPTHPQPEIVEGGVPGLLLVRVSEVKLTRFGQPLLGRRCAEVSWCSAKPGEGGHELAQEAAGTILPDGFVAGLQADGGLLDPIPAPESEMGVCGGSAGSPRSWLRSGTFSAYRIRSAPQERAEGWADACRGAGDSRRRLEVRDVP
jgi:hypothetical protein